VEVNNSFHDVQANPKTLLRVLASGLGPNEEIEYARQQLRRDSDSAVRNSQLGPILRPDSNHDDAPAVLRVIGGVAQQVHDDLFHPDCVGIQPERIGRQGHGDLMLAVYVC
jgi:hypothetical protein